MSYGELYRIPFFDVDENKFILQIEEDGYTGNFSTNLTLGPNPVTVSYRCGDNFFKPIIGSSCKLQFYVEEGTGGGVWQLEDSNWNLTNFLWNQEGSIDLLEPTNDREFRVKVNNRIVNGTSDAYSPTARLKDTDVNFTTFTEVGDLVINTVTNETTTVAQVSSSTIIKLSADIFSASGGETYEIYKRYWTGFIVQDSFELPLQDMPFVITAYATDLIGTLDGYDYELTTARPSAFEAIRECLRQINLQNGQGDSGKSLDLSYKFLCRLRQLNADGSQPSKGNPFAQTHINSSQAFENQNGNPLDAKFVLNNLLVMFNCRIFQHQGTWTVISNDSYSLSAFDQNYSSSNPSQFITYDKNGSNESTKSISNSELVKNIETTGNNDTIMPIGKDLVKNIKPPAFKHRVNIKIENNKLDKITNGGFEDTSSPSGSIPSSAYAINTWTITDTSTTFAVDSSTTTFGITPYEGSKCMLNIGNDSGGGDNNIIASNNSSVLSNTFEDIQFSFAVFADQPVTTDGNLLDYFFYFRISVLQTGTSNRFYYNLNTGNWTMSSQKNNIRDEVANEWVRHDFTLNPCPVTGNFLIEFYEPEEANFPSGTNFRFYIDEVRVSAKTDLKYYSTLVDITNTQFRKNSGVIKPITQLFGQIGDAGYSNCLTDSSGNPIRAYDNFDLSYTESLEKLMARLRLSDLAINNNKYEGTFRKTKNSDGSYIPISMLTFPKLNFTSMPDNTDQIAIDSLIYNMKNNRFKLKMHTPNQTSLTDFNDISVNKGYFNSKPEDSSEPISDFGLFKV